MNIINFYDPNDIRDYFKSPFKLNGRVVASTGNVFISMPEYGDYPYCPAGSIAKFEKILTLFEDDREFVPMPDNLFFPEKHVCRHCNGSGKATAIICAECDGEGEVDFNNFYNDYFFECKSCEGVGKQVTAGGDERCANCDGTGYVFLINSCVDVLGILVNQKLLNFIINETGIEISPSHDKRKLFFRTGECEGLIMGMHP